jgi:transposase
MERAGWHCAYDLATPESIPAVLLPPYSPEVDAIERLWLYLKERLLLRRLWRDYNAIVDALCKAWQQVTCDSGRVKYLRSMEWAIPVRK